MYQIGKAVFLNAEENEKLLANELYLTEVNYVESEKEVPEEYSFKYTEGIDLDLF